MKKKLLAILLCLTMVVMLLPTMAFAAAGTYTIDGSTHSVLGDQSGDGWKYDEDGYYGDPMLILCGYDGGAISSNFDLTIYLAADTQNTITVPSGSTEDGIHCDGKIYLSGYGDLTINAPNAASNGISSDYDSGDEDVSLEDLYGTITIDVGGNGISAPNGEFEIDYSYADISITAGKDGIYANLVYLNSDTFGVITIDAGENGLHSVNSYCEPETRGILDITADKDGMVSDHSYVELYNYSGKITIDAGEDGLKAAESGVYVYNYGDVEINADDGGVYAGSTVYLGPRGGDVTINAGGYGVWTASSVEMKSYNDAISNGAISITSGEDGIFAYDGDVTVGDSSSRCTVGLTVESTGGNAVTINDSGNYFYVYTNKPVDLTAGSGRKAVSGTVSFGSDADYYKTTDSATSTHVAYTPVAPYSLTINGSTYSYTALTSDKNVTGWSWTASSKTLTLNGYDGGYIYAYGDLSIVLASGTTNKITVPSGTDEDGINVSSGDLNLSGAGDLQITVKNDDGDGISVDSGDVAIEMSGDCSIHSGDSCFCVYGGVEITGSGDISLTSDDGYGIYAYGKKLSITGSGALFIIADVDGICNDGGAITIDRGGKVSITSGDAGVYQDNGEIIIGEDCEVEITSSSEGIKLYYTGSLVIGEGAAVTVTADNGGIFSYGDLLIDNDGELNVYVDGEEGYGLEAESSVTFKGKGAVNITSDENAVYIYEDGNVVFAGTGSVSITAEDSYAIYLDDDYSLGNSVLLNGADSPITLTAGDGYYAVYRDGDYESPVAGSKFENYSVEGAPDEAYVQYTCDGEEELGDADPVYAVSVETAENGTVKASTKSTQKGRTVTITVTADKGYALESLSVTDKKGKEIDVKDLGDGKYSFKMPASKVTVEAVFEKAGAAAAENSFVDVKAADYYYDAVQWAAENGITSGTDATHFSPALKVTRAQVVTFLYRMAQLEGKGFKGAWAFQLDYTDKASIPDYAYEAIAWCSMNKIVSGYDTGAFGANDNVTREQLAVMLYNFAKYMGEEGFTGAWYFPLDFADAQSVSAWADEAMHWCVMNKIVGGKDGNRLDPQGLASRAEVVCMLQRFNDAVFAD